MAENDAKEPSRLFFGLIEEGEPTAFLSHEHAEKKAVRPIILR